MKKTGFITFSAVMSALATVIMLLAYLPYLTYSAPAISGLFIMIVLFECGTKYAFMGYITSAILVLLTAEPEAAVTYALFFGVYPILKVFLEKIHNIVLRYAAKLIVFNTIILLIYAVVLKIIGIDGDLTGNTKYMTYILIITANVFFVVYDYALVKLSGFYYVKFHDRIARLIKKR